MHMKTHRVPVTQWVQTSFDLSVRNTDRCNVLPNEVMWQDGELFPGRWVMDSSGEGQVGQHYPLPFLFRLFDKLDRDEAIREQNERQGLNFELLREDDRDECRCATYERNRAMRTRHKQRRFPAQFWADPEPEEMPLPEFYEEVELIQDVLIVPTKLWLLERL